MSDGGPGIPNLDEIFAGRYKSDTGMGMGITGTRRLWRTNLNETSASGTNIRDGKASALCGRAPNSSID